MTTTTTPTATLEPPLAADVLPGAVVLVRTDAVANAATLPRAHANGRATDRGALAALARHRFVPAVVTGRQLYQGTASVCVGLEPVLDDVVVPLARLLQVRPALGAAVLRDLGRLRAEVDGSTPSSSSATLLTHQAEGAKRSRAPPPRHQDDDGGVRRENHLPPLSARYVSALWKAVEQACCSLAGGLAGGLHLLVLQRPCASLDGLPGLFALVGGLLRAAEETDAGIAAAPKKASPSSFSLRCMLVVGRPAHISSVCQLVDAVAAELDREASRCERGGVRSAHLYPTRPSTGSIDGDQDVRPAGLTVYVASADDAVHWCLSSEASTTASMARCTGTNANEVLLMAAADFPALDAVLSAREAWPEHLRTAVPIAEEQLGIQSRTTPTDESYVPPQVRLNVPVSLRQLNHVATVSTQRFVPLLLPNGRSLTDVYDLLLAGACNNNDDGIGALREAEQVDARLWALRAAVHYQMPTSTKPVRSSLPSYHPCVIGVGSSLLPSESLQALLGIPVILVNPGATHAQVRTSVRQWSAHVQALLHLSLPSVVTAPPSSAFRGAGDGDTVWATQDPLVPMLLIQHSDVLLSIGAAAERVATSWRCRLGRCTRRARDLPFFTIGTDLDAALEQAAVDAGGSGGDDRNVAAVCDALLRHRVSRTWQGDFGEAPTASALHRRYGGADGSDGSQAGKKQHRAEEEAPPLPVASGVPPKGRVSSRGPFTDPLPHEHPLETQLRVACGTCSIPAASIAALAGIQATISGS